MMKKNRVLRGLKYVLFGIVFAAVFGCCGHEPVELAHAGPVRLACHYLLAGARALLILSKILFGGCAAGPDLTCVLAPPHDGAMGADDARGT